MDSCTPRYEVISPGWNLQDAAGESGKPDDVEMIEIRKECDLEEEEEEEAGETCSEEIGETK